MSLLHPSLIITTYNKPDYLDLVLTSVAKQRHLPLEVIVADDGSREETKKLVDKFRKSAPFPVIHVWQEDKGFRLSKIRNEAISVCKSEYIIVIDGDVVLHPKFVLDHIHYALPGYFIAGGKLGLQEEATKKILEQGVFYKDTTGIPFKKRLKNKRIPILTPLTFKHHSDNHRYAVGANMSFWTKDIKAINGCDEEYVGWGYEDQDLMLRFMNSGIKKRHLRHSAIMYHLYHSFSQGSEESRRLNRERLERSEASGATYCKMGIVKEIKEDEVVIIR